MTVRAETSALNRCLTKIRHSIVSARASHVRQIQGHAMLPSLDLFELGDGRVPASWHAALPPDANFDTIGKAMDFCRDWAGYWKDWIQRGPPATLWLGAFTNITLLINCVKLRHARAFEVPIDLVAPLPHVEVISAEESNELRTVLPVNASATHMSTTGLNPSKACRAGVGVLLSGGQILHGKINNGVIEPCDLVVSQEIDRMHLSVLELTDHTSPCCVPHSVMLWMCPVVHSDTAADRDSQNTFESMHAAHLGEHLASQATLLGDHEWNVGTPLSPGRAGIPRLFFACPVYLTSQIVRNPDFMGRAQWYFCFFVPIACCVAPMVLFDVQTCLVFARLPH